MKWLPLTIAKHVRRYKSICAKACRGYDRYVRYVCITICIRFVHRCDPRLGEAYVACVENATNQAIALVEGMRDRLAV